MHIENREDADIINLKTTEQMLIDLQDNFCISKLSTKLSEYCKPNKPGIYTTTSHNPVLVPNNKYYTREGLMTNKPITQEEFPSIVENVYNSDGTLAVSSFLMRDKSSLLSTKPKINQAIPNIVHLVINDYLKSMRYRDFDSEDLIYSLKHFIRQDKQDEIDSNFIDEIVVIIDPIILSIMDFVDEDIHHIYFVDLLNDQNLVIRKTVDFRIYEYTKLQYAEPEEINESSWSNFK